MPPHCDSMDGPVVTAAARALDRHEVDLVLPFVPKEGEGEVCEAFTEVLPVHEQGGSAGWIADLHFFETVVRIHRAGEGEPYTGLKPAGLSRGPVVHLVERAIETGDPEPLVALLTGTVDAQVRERFARVLELRWQADGDVDATRAYVEAMLDLEVWSHKLHTCAHGPAHEHGAGAGHGHEH